MAVVGTVEETEGGGRRLVAMCMNLMFGSELRDNETNV